MWGSGRGAVWGLRGGFAGSVLGPSFCGRRSLHVALVWGGMRRTLVGCGVPSALCDVLWGARVSSALTVLSPRGVRAALLLIALFTHCVCGPLLFTSVFAGVGCVISIVTLRGGPGRFLLQAFGL